MAEARAIQHHAYLQALGIPLYVSRSALPGAAPSLRLPMPQPRTPVAPPLAQGARASEGEPVAAPAAPMARVAVEAGSRRRREAAADAAPATDAPATAGSPHSVAQLCMVAVFAGPFLWLEELPQQVLERDQVELIQAMAAALGATGNRPRVTQFDWPPHQNRQLDLGEAAARAALGSFITRQVELGACEAVVLLGAGCRQWVGELPATLPCVTTAGTREMLLDPSRKREVWRDLQPLRRRGQ